MKVFDPDDEESLNDMLYDRYRNDNSAIWSIVALVVLAFLLGFAVYKIVTAA